MRLPRLSIPGLPQHVVMCGHNANTVFFEQHDYLTFKHFLQQACEKFDCVLHAYTLMPDHVHLLITPQHNKSVGRAIQLLSRLYVQYFNQRYSRSGSLWEGRYKSAIVDEQSYGVACCMFIELNPCRNKVCARAEDYLWSSYKHNALGEKDVLVTSMDSLYLLGSDERNARNTYRELAEDGLSTSELHLIRSETYRSRVVGGADFRKAVAAYLGVSLVMSARGGDRRSMLFREAHLCA